MATIKVFAGPRLAWPLRGFRSSRATMAVRVRTLGCRKADPSFKLAMAKTSVIRLLWGTRPVMRIAFSSRQTPAPPSHSGRVLQMRADGTQEVQIDVAPQETSHRASSLLKVPTRRGLTKERRDSGKNQADRSTPVMSTPEPPQGPQRCPFPRLTTAGKRTRWTRLRYRQAQTGAIG